MTEVAAPAHPRVARLPRPSVTSSRLGAGVVYLFVLTLCALAAYWLMFAQFAVYDDEGFFDYSVQLFALGHPLYTSVFSDYGPFYYVVFGGFFALIGHGVTTDAGRLIQLTMWLIASFGIGVTAHRLSGRLTIGVASLATAFLLLNGTTSEPMHPGALICVMLAGLTAVVAFRVRDRPRSGMALVGAIGAALALTKVNVGGYAVVSIAFATVMAGDSLMERTWLRRLVIAAFVLIGPTVMYAKLNQGWARSYAFLAVASTVAVVFVALPSERRPDPRQSGTWVLPLIVGCAACIAVIFGIVFALGTSPMDLIDQVLILPAGQGNVLVIPITLDNDVIWWSLAAAGGAWTWRRSRGRGDLSRPSLADGLLRTGAGVAILMSLGSESIFSIVPNANFALAMPLAWVAALPSRRDASSPQQRLVRLLIPSLAVLQALLAYPVAGTQVLLGSILLILCGAVCLADGWAELVAVDAVRCPGGLLASSSLTALFAALAIGAVYVDIVQPLQINRDLYRGNTALTVPGATRLRINLAQGGPIDQTVALVRSRCRTLIELPGLYSFNIWTGLPTPSPLTGEQPYWRLLSRAQQLKVVAAARSSPELCVVRDDSDAALYGGAPAGSPLVAYINRTFTPLAAFPPYVVEIRRAPARRPS